MCYFLAFLSSSKKTLSSINISIIIILMGNLLVSLSHTLPRHSRWSYHSSHNNVKQIAVFIFQSCHGVFTELFSRLAKLLSNVGQFPSRLKTAPIALLLETAVEGNYTLLIFLISVQPSTLSIIINSEQHT